MDLLSSGLTLRDDESLYDTSFASYASAFLSLGALSLCASCVVALVFALSPSIHRDHASKLILIITLCDMAYTMKFMFASAVYLSGQTSPTKSFFLISDHCVTSAAWAQFFSMACISWNACWIFDFVCILHNPLRNTASQRRWYHLFVWGISASTTIYVIAVTAENTDHETSCWVRSDNSVDLVFRIPLLTYQALAVASLIYAAYRLNRGTVATRTLRRAVFVRHVVYVVAFFILWIWPVFHGYTDPDSNSKFLTWMDTIMISIQASVFAAIRLSQPGAWPLLRDICSKIVQRTALVLNVWVPCCKWAFGEYMWNYTLAFMCLCGCRCNPRNMGFGTPQEYPREDECLLFDAHRNRREDRPETSPLLMPYDGRPSNPVNMAGPSIASRKSSAERPPRPESMAVSGNAWIAKGLSSTYRNPILEEEKRTHEILQQIHPEGSRVMIVTSAYALNKPLANILDATARSTPPLEPTSTKRPSRVSDDNSLNLQFAEPTKPSPLPIEIDGSEVTRHSSRSSSFTGALTGMFSRIVANNTPSKPDDIRTPLLSNDVEIAREDSASSGFTRADSRSRVHTATLGIEAAAHVAVSVPPEPRSRVHTSPIAPIPVPAALAAVVRSESTQPSPSPQSSTGSDAVDAFGQREFSIQDLLRNASVIAAGKGEAAASARRVLGPDIVKPAAESTTTVVTSRDAPHVTSPDGPHVKVAHGMSLKDAMTGDIGKGWDVLYALRLEEALCMLSGLCQSAIACEAKQRMNTMDREPIFDADVPSMDMNGLLQHPTTFTMDMPLLSQFDWEAYLSREIDEELNKLAKKVDAERADAKKVDGKKVDAKAPAATPAVSNARFAAYTDSRFELSSFADRTFAEIRAAAAIQSSQIVYALDPYLLRSGDLRAHFSEGASSSFFCRSADQQLVVKTVTEAEVKELLRMLPAYKAHLLKFPDTLLCRFYGCYCLKLSKSTPAYFILMGNAFPVVDPGPCSETFDLKGSTVGRRARISKSIDSRTKEGKTVAKGMLYQDMEFREMHPFGLPACDHSTDEKSDAVVDSVFQGLGRSQAIVDQLKIDTALLASFGLMDYSLLINVMPVEGNSLGPDAQAMASYYPNCDIMSPTADARPRGDGISFKLSLNKAAELQLDDCISMVNAACALPARIASCAYRVAQHKEIERITRWSPLAVSVCAIGSSQPKPEDSRPAHGVPTRSPDSATHDTIPASSSSVSLPHPSTPRSTVSEHSGAPGDVVTISGYHKYALVQIGLIDMLQSYDVSKRVENTFKTFRHAVAHANMGADISSVNPILYATRFVKFSEQIFLPTAVAHLSLTSPSPAVQAISPSSTTLHTIEEYPLRI